MIKEGTKRALGASGEGLVIRQLEGEGYKVIARNVVCRHGEIDIIAQREGHIDFFEVKTRTGRAYAAASAVDKRKAAALVSAVNQYLYEHPTTLCPGIHVAEVYLLPFDVEGSTWYLVDSVNIIRNCINSTSEQRYSRRDY